MRIRDKILIFVLLFLFPLILESKDNPPIRFKANKVEYIYKKGKEATICRGSAHIWRNDFDLDAYIIKLYGKDNDIAKAYKNVILKSKTNNIIIKSDYAEYNNKISYAKFFKNPILKETNRKLEIRSALMESYIDKNISIALGNVFIKGTNYTAYCEKCIYYQDKARIELVGNPIVYYEDDIFKSDKIIVYIRKKKVKLYGNVEANLSSGR